MFNPSLKLSPTLLGEIALFAAVFISPKLGLEKWSQVKIGQAHVPGSWTISVELPPCEGDIEYFYPERQGDVLLVACKNMPVDRRDSK